jgi:hypothetical protein
MGVVADAISDAADWVADAVSDAVDFVGLDKDGFLTNFLTDYIPGAGLVAAGFHAASGNMDEAEFAAVRGTSTFIEAAAAVAGAALAGPLGAALAAGLASMVTSLWEAGMKTYMAESMKHKIVMIDFQSHWRR